MTAQDLHHSRRDPRRSIRWRWVAIAGLAAVLGQGCSPFSKPSLVQQSFAFEPSSSTTTNQPAATRPAVTAVLEVRKVQVQSPFNNQSFVYRTGENSFEQDPYAQFLAPPGESLTSAVEESIRRSGVFRDVAEPGSLLRAQMVLELYVTALYGDFRNGQTPAAVLNARFVFFGPAQGGQRTVVLDHEYQERVPVSARTAAALARGWNQALSRMTAQAVQDAQKAESKQ